MQLYGHKGQKSEKELLLKLTNSSTGSIVKTIFAGFMEAFTVMALVKQTPICGRKKRNNDDWLKLHELSKNTETVVEMMIAENLGG